MGLLVDKTAGGFKTKAVLGAEWWKQRGQVLAFEAFTSKQTGRRKCWNPLAGGEAGPPCSGNGSGKLAQPDLAGLGVGVGDMSIPGSLRVPLEPQLPKCVSALWAGAFLFSVFLSRPLQMGMGNAPAHTAGSRPSRPSHRLNSEHLSEWFHCSCILKGKGF